MVFQLGTKTKDKLQAKTLYQPPAPSCVLHRFRNISKNKYLELHGCLLTWEVQRGKLFGLGKKGLVFSEFPQVATDDG